MLASFGVVSYGSISRSSSVPKLILSVLPRWCTLPPTCTHHDGQKLVAVVLCKLELTRGSMFCTVQVPISVHVQTQVLAHARHNTRAYITRTDATQCMGANTDALAKDGTITPCTLSFARARARKHEHMHRRKSTQTHARTESHSETTQRTR